MERSAWWNLRYVSRIAIKGDVFKYMGREHTDVDVCRHDGMVR
jgi:hypothetical protein